MDQIHLLADMLRGNLDFLKWTISDFSDADMLVRPVPNANHAMWQIGHVMNSEAGALTQLNPQTPGLPTFAEKFNRQTASIDDPDFFPRKAELLDAFANVRAATVGWVKSLKPEELDKPTPEKIRKWAPTIGHLLASTPIHVGMHVGQIQVIRRKLGKPVLF